MCISIPDPNLIVLCYTVFHVLLFFFSLGVVVGVDEEKAFSWPICNRCHGDELGESADNPR